MSSSKKKSKDVEVHVCRFIDYKPSSICAAHLHSDNKHCAIGRENGNIEIWDLNGSFIQRTIPGKGANTVQSLLWINDPHNKNKPLRLISCGLNGWITEWDLESLCVHSKISCSGYAIWDIAQSSITQTGDILISAACDDGKLRVYKLTPNEFIFQCEFITSGRCLSTIWSQESYEDSKASIVVYGGTSNGLIFGYDIISRQQMSNIVVAPPAVGGVRKKAATKPLIWALCSMPHLNQIACSTSRGNIDVFDVQFGTLIQSINAAKNDIFSLKYVHSDHDNVLVAGCCDGRVLQLTQRKLDSVSAMKNDYVLTGYHRYHTHDVNVVSITDSKVVSGGVDCQLISCNTRDFWTHFICSPLSNINASSNIIKVAHDIEWIKDVLPCDSEEAGTKKKLANTLFLHQKDRMMELWYLYGTKPVKIMDVHVGFTVFNISCCSLSNDGKWIAVANNECVKLWKIVIANQSVQLAKVFETTKRGSSTINFSKNSKYLFLTPNVCNTQSMNEDNKINEEDIGLYLDSCHDNKANIIRINLENGDQVKIDQEIHLHQRIAHCMISSLNLNVDASLCSIIVPSVLYGAIVHIAFGKIFYEVPKGSHHNNVSCIEFQRTVNEKNNQEQEVLYVIYANNAIKMMYYDYYLETNKLFKVRNNIRLHLWCSSNSKLWGIYNKKNPFAFTKILFNPSTVNKALLLRPEYMFSLVVNKKLPDTHFAGVGTKRTFGMMSNNNNAKGKQMDAKRMRIDQLIPSPFGKPQGGKDKNRKKNKLSFLRVIRKYDPIVCAEFVDGNTLLIVHTPWHKVSASFKKPLYRKKYGI